MTDESYSFSTARARLEEIVTQVRKKDTSLEKSLDLLEEGVRLANACTELIDHADWTVGGVGEAGARRRARRRRLSTATAPPRPTSRRADDAMRRREAVDAEDDGRRRRVTRSDDAVDDAETTPTSATPRTTRSRRGDCARARVVPLRPERSMLDTFMHSHATRCATDGRDGARARTNPRLHTSAVRPQGPLDEAQLAQLADEIRDRTRDHGLEDGRPPRAQPRRRRAHARHPSRARLPARPHHLRRRAPVLRAQAAHRAAATLLDAAPVRRRVRLPEAQREPVRRLRHRARVRLALGRARACAGARGAGRRRDGRRRHRRRLDDRRHGVRGAQPHRASRHAARHRAQRQRDVDLRERRRARELPGARAPRPALQPAARRRRDQARDDERRPRDGRVRRGGQGLVQAARSCRACSSRSSA